MHEKAVEQSLLGLGERGHADIVETVGAQVRPRHTLFSLGHADEAVVHLLDAGGGGVGGPQHGLLASDQLQGEHQHPREWNDKASNVLLICRSNVNPNP